MRGQWWTCRVCSDLIRLSCDVGTVFRRLSPCKVRSILMLSRVGVVTVALVVNSSVLTGLGWKWLSRLMMIDVLMISCWTTLCCVFRGLVR